MGILEAMGVAFFIVLLLLIVPGALLYGADSRRTDDRGSLADRR
jgi:hypothetical protein